MELNFTLFFTAIGALVGTIVGVLVMNRKIRAPISDADLAELRGKLENTESSLAAANTTLEDLRKQIAERDQTLQQNAKELKKKQEQFDLVLAEAEKEKTQRSSAEQKAGELIAQIATLREHAAALEITLEAERKVAGEQQEVQKRQIQTLTEQVDGLIAESAALSRFRELESRHRSTIEAQLAAEQEHVKQLTEQIAKLESQQSQVDLRLQEEKQSAARGMEFLLMAQENFSRVFKAVSADRRDGENGRVVRAATTRSEEPSENLEIVHSALSAE